MATENLEAIVMWHNPRNWKEIQAMATLRVDALAQMNRLKLLMLSDLNFSGSLNFLSSELGYLCWNKYPFTSLPSSFEPDKLVDLILPHSNIKQLWKGTKSLHNLTHIDLSHSKNLVQIPNAIGWLHCLEKLNLGAHDDPTSLGTRSKPRIMLGFQSKRFGCFSITPHIHLGKDLVTVDVDHLLLTFLSKERFISSTRTLTKELMHDTSGIELVAVVKQPLGLHFEVKNCGYQWIFEENLEQLNPQMMYTGSSSVQPYY
ncbi:disease resistance protein RUN1 [Trifolium repens]|nr:disease resistance protein RUN1 [Trifolium repens]